MPQSPTQQPNAEPITWTRARQVYDSMLAQAETRLRAQLDQIVSARARGYIPIDLREDE